MPNAAVAETGAGLSPAGLAAKHGLTVAGARPSVAAYLRRLWTFRHFTIAYANAKVIASFSTTRLGRIWQVLTPLTNAAVYYLIFGVIIGSDRGMDNFIAYLCTGLFIFHFTSSVVSAGTQSITGNLSLIRALHFPRATLPIAVTLTQFQNLAWSMGVLAVIVLTTGEPLTLEWFLLPPALVLQSVFNAGLALGMARLGSKIIDLKQVMPFVLRTWMYGSGVLYSVTLFTKHLPPTIATIVQANPLLVYIELARHALMETAPITASPARLWLLGGAWAVLAVVGGFLYFWRGEQEYGRG
jgi:teichoic acid transport system permease protein